MKHRVMMCAMIAMLAIAAYAVKAPPMSDDGGSVVVLSDAIPAFDVPSEPSPPAMTQIALYILEQAIVVDDVARTGRSQTTQSAIFKGTWAAGGALSFKDEVAAIGVANYSVPVVKSLRYIEVLRC